MEAAPAIQWRLVVRDEKIRANKLERRHGTNALHPILSSQHLWQFQQLSLVLTPDSASVMCFQTLQLAYSPTYYFIKGPVCNI